VEIPKTPRAAKLLDEVNGDTLWKESIEKELYQIIHEFNSFKIVKEEEGCDKINPALTAIRLKPQSITPYQSGVTTTSCDEVTVIIIQYKYFEYVN
jgi:hypothetical protein